MASRLDAQPLKADYACIPKNTIMKIPVKVIDLFAGCGGLSLGFQNAGFEVISAYEYWKPAAVCYRKNFTHPVYESDLSDTEEIIKQIRRQNPQMLIGGAPCQDFSHAGKRIEGTRADLTRAFAKIIRGVSPELFLMENVDRAKSSKSYASARKILKQCGYGLTEVVLDASYCGAPQKRKRFFCIGKKNAKDGFMEEYILSRLAEMPLTVRQYLGSEFGLEYYYRHPRNYSRRGIYSIDEPSPTVRGVNRPVPAGYKGHSGDPVKVSKNIRSLTTFERARIQSFPKGFVFVGNKTDLEQMIGNAVPVKQAEFVARAIMNFEKTGGDSKEVVK